MVWFLCVVAHVIVVVLCDDIVVWCGWCGEGVDVYVVGEVVLTRNR